MDTGSPVCPSYDSILAIRLGAWMERPEDKG